MLNCATKQRPIAIAHCQELVRRLAQQKLWKSLFDA